MTAVLIVVALAMLALLAGKFGYRRAEREGHSLGTWWGLAILALLFVCMWLAGNSGNESLAYAFGAALMLALPVLLVIGVARAIGSALRRRQNKCLKT
jgi:uncharacterized membrane protein (UPF0136 family)